MCNNISIEKKNIGNGIWKTPCTWRFYGNGSTCANFSMGKYHETKMGDGAQKAISSSKPWACFMKNISLIIVFFFSQANLAFKLNLTCHNLFTFLYVVHLGIHPVPLCFFTWTSKTLMRLNIFFEGLQPQNFLIMVLFSMKPLYLPTAKITPGVNNSL